MASMLQIQQKAPMTLNVMKSLSLIPPTPATTGENVLMIGMNWASTIVLCPYFW